MERTFILNASFCQDTLCRYLDNDTPQSAAIRRQFFSLYKRNLQNKGNLHKNNYRLVELAEHKLGCFHKQNESSISVYFTLWGRDTASWSTGRASTLDTKGTGFKFRPEDLIGSRRYLTAFDISFKKMSGQYLKCAIATSVLAFSPIQNSPINLPIKRQYFRNRRKYVMTDGTAILCEDTKWL